MDAERVDPFALRIAARSARKTPGRLGELVRASLGLVWSSGRRMLVALIALQVLGAASLAGQVLAVQSVLTAILHGVSARAVAGVAPPVIALAALTALTATFGVLAGQLQRLLGETVARTMWGKLVKVATSVGLGHFESAEFYNRLNRVQASALTRPYQVTQGLLSLLGAMAASLTLGVALVSLSPILLPLVALSGVPILLTSRKESRLEFDFSVRQTPRMRLRSYFALLQTGRDEAKEVRAFGLADWLRGRFDSLYESYLIDLREHVKRRAILSLVGQLGSAFVLGGTLLFLTWLIALGQIGIAAAGAGIVAVRMLGAQVQQVFASVQSVFESGLFLDDLAQFLELGQAAQEEEAGQDAPSSFQTIRLNGVRFSYPGSDVEALRGVDIELLEGQVVALVGENGSGKTTLAKLLAGLYRPDAGRITWDGVDVAIFRPSSVRERISVVFQDFVRYALSGTDNIAVGRIDEEVDPSVVRAAAVAAGATGALDALPNGFDTILSRMFEGGRDLSGGQWQRLALARSFYRDAPLVILDEPSASLDPRAEHDLFATLRQSLRGRTALFISHRFSTVRGADRIYVLNDGEVVEHGTHDDLVARQGRYAELYRLQAQVDVAGEPGGQA